MGKYKVEILLAAWQDIDRISDVYLRLAGAASAKKITDALLDTLARLGDFPYMGAQHPDPELARREFRKVLCGDLVCVYKVIGQSVFVYRVVNGRTDYPQLLKKKQKHPAPQKRISAERDVWLQRLGQLIKRFFCPVQNGIYIVALDVQVFGGDAVGAADAQHAGQGLQIVIAEVFPLDGAAAGGD